MAFEGGLESLVGISASADLSAKQFCAVKFSGDKTVTFAGAGEKSCGILQDKPVSGEACNVAKGGISKAKIGGNVAAGANLMSDAAGVLITATSGNHVVAVALEAGVSGDIISVNVSPATAPLA